MAWIGAAVAVYALSRWRRGRDARRRLRAQSGAVKRLLRDEGPQAAVHRTGA